MRNLTELTPNERGNTTKDFNKQLILAAIEDCRSQKQQGDSTDKVKNNLLEIGFPLDLSLFITQVAFN